VTRIALATALAAVAATAANLLLRALAVAVFDIPQPEFEPLQVRAVILSTVGGVIAAGLAYALIEWLARDPVKTFYVVAGVALLASLYAPIALGLQDPPENPGTDAGSVGTLIVMHVVTAVIVVAALTGRRRPGRAGRRRPGRDPAHGRDRP
jgi:predicted benzoate:H+ symporter BenE